MALFSLVQNLPFSAITCLLYKLLYGGQEKGTRKVSAHLTSFPHPPRHRTAPSKLDRIRRGVPRTHSLKDPVPL